MTAVLDKLTVIDMLERGAWISGEPLTGYSIYLEHQPYDGWTVRWDTLAKLYSQGLLNKEQSATSTNFIYTWKNKMKSAI
jgi:hypothetical protein